MHYIWYLNGSFYLSQGSREWESTKTFAFKSIKWNSKSAKKERTLKFHKYWGVGKAIWLLYMKNHLFELKKVCVCWKQTQLCRKGKENRFWPFQCVQWQWGNQETPVGKIDFPSRMRKSTFFSKLVSRMKERLFFKQPLLFFNQDRDQESVKGIFF